MQNYEKPTSEESLGRRTKSAVFERSYKVFGIHKKYFNRAR